MLNLGHCNLKMNVSMALKIFNYILGFINILFFGGLIAVLFSVEKTNLLSTDSLLVTWMTCALIVMAVLTVIIGLAAVMGYTVIEKKAKKIFKKQATKQAPEIIYNIIKDIAPEIIRQTIKEEVDKAEKRTAVSKEMYDTFTQSPVQIQGSTTLDKITKKFNKSKKEEV